PQVLECDALDSGLIQREASNEECEEKETLISKRGEEHDVVEHHDYENAEENAEAEFLSSSGLGKGIAFPDLERGFDGTIGTQPQEDVVARGIRKRKKQAAVTNGTRMEGHTVARSQYGEIRDARVELDVIHALLRHLEEPGSIRSRFHPKANPECGAAIAEFASLCGVIDESGQEGSLPNIVD